MKWRAIASALGHPLKACFDLTVSERRLLLGVLILFAIGLIAREIHRRDVGPATYRPPPMEPTQP